MRVAAREGLFFAAALLLGLALNSGKGSAAECGDFYEGAKVGPPPEWSFWADGSACFVRWVPDDDSHEERLLERCQNTPGARFVHFERRKAKGHSICIFKVLDSQPGELLVQHSEPSSIGDGKADLQAETASPPMSASDPDIVLENLEALVRGKNEDCLGKEREQDPFGAGACWKAAAHEVTQFIDANPLPRKDLERKLDELRETWLARAAQLEGTVAQPREQAILIQPSSIGSETNSDEEVPDSSREESDSEETDATVDQPVDQAVPGGSGSRSHEGPDPERLSATMSCSSTALGNDEDCVNSARPSGANRYAFALKSRCRKKGSIAAIRTTDARGRCIRRVVTLLPSGDGVIVESYGEPSVIDAIEYGSDRHQCYERRHDNISCDGEVDYSSQQNAETADEKSEVATPQPRKKVAKKRTKKSKKARRKTPRKTQAVAKAPSDAADPPKQKSKREDEPKVIRNYTQKPEPRERVRKAKVAEVQSKPKAAGPEKPSVACLLFSKFC
jgi:hypothetical protein